MANIPNDLSGQEQFDDNAATETPQSEAASGTNDMQVNFETAPDSGNGGSYPTLEIHSSVVADTTGNVLGPRC